MKRTAGMKRRGTEVLTIALAGLLAATLLAACAGPRGAGLDRSQEVWRAFMDGQVMAGHRYYTTGVQNAPDAILGIQEGYMLETERWAERKITPQDLRRLVGMMNDKFMSSSSGLLGSWVLDDKGERIGIWYSPIGLTTVEMLDSNKVRVSPPHPEALRKYEERTRGK